VLNVYTPAAAFSVGLRLRGDSAPRQAVTSTSILSFWGAGRAPLVVAVGAMFVDLLGPIDAFGASPQLWPGACRGGGEAVRLGGSVRWVCCDSVKSEKL
jgi:hypothetical protein